MKNLYIGLIALALITTTGCKKKGCTDPTATNYSEEAKKDDGSCVFAEPTPSYTIPTTYGFTDDSGNSTVVYSGQTDRLNQLRELVAKAKTAKDGIVSAQDLKDMFANTGGNGNGNFTFTSTRQIKDKFFSADVALMESFLDSLALLSVDFGATASNGQAGTLTTGSSEYLFSQNGIEYVQLIEKITMGALMMNQALNVYFGAGKMDVDNTTAVNPTNGEYYTTMEHHWDEAFGYFGVAADFPTTIATDFWGKYSNSQDATLGSNAILMNAFLKGRAAISNNNLTDRNAAIQTIREMWENVSAHQAMKYLDDAVANFGTDQAKFLHVLSEAYAFVYCLRYAPTETRNLSQTEVTDIITLFGGNFWDLSVSQINAIKAAIDAKY